MNIGIVEIELKLPGNDSLKAKRMVLRSLKERIKKHFNVSIAEVGDQDKWQKAILGVACVGADKRYVNGVLSKVVDLIEGAKLVELLDYQMELW